MGFLVPSSSCCIARWCEKMWLSMDLSVDCSNREDSRVHWVVTFTELQTSPRSHGSVFTCALCLVLFLWYLLPSFLRTPLKLSFLLLFHCFINIKPCLISTTCWIVGLMGLHSTDQRNRRNTDLPKWFIKHKEPCLASRPTHSEPKLSLLSKSQLCLLCLPETPRSVAPLRSPQRHLVTEPHTAGKRRIAWGCSGKPCTSYFL